MKWWRERIDALQKEADQSMVDEDDKDANIVEDDGDHEDEGVDKKLDDDQLVDDQVDQGGVGKKEEDEEEELDQSSCISMFDNFINSVRDPSNKKIATTTDQCEGRNEDLIEKNLSMKLLEAKLNHLLRLKRPKIMSGQILIRALKKKILEMILSKGVAKARPQKRPQKAFPQKALVASSTVLYAYS